MIFASIIRHFLKECYSDLCAAQQTWLFLLSNSRPEVFCKKDNLRNFVKFTGKQRCQSLFFNKVASLIFLTPCNFIKKETLVQVFSCNFCKISKKTFSYRTPLVTASVSTRLEIFHQTFQMFPHEYQLPPQSS